MKKQTIENVLEDERILLHENKKAIDFQSYFIYRLETMFNDLITALDALELDDVEFEHSDIQKFGVYRMSALNFIKGKVIPTIKDPKIAGKKTTPEKVFEMMAINLRSFTPLFDAVNSFIIDQITDAAKRDLAIEFDSAFFDLQANQVSVNRLALCEWDDKRCRIFVEGEKQLEVYTTVKSIADALNNLKKIGSRSLQAIDNLHRNPRFYASDWMGRLIVFDEETESFIVNHGFVSRH